MGATLSLASLPSSGSLNDQMCHFVVILQSIYCRSVPASLGAAEIRCLSSRVCTVASVEQTDQHGICAQCSHSIQIQELLLGKQGTRTCFLHSVGLLALAAFLLPQQRRSCLHGDQQPPSWTASHSLMTCMICRCILSPACVI